MIIFKDYNLCILDLITEQKAGETEKKISGAKIWMHLGNIIMSKIMLSQDHVDVWLFAAYGAIVGGSYVAIQFVKWRFRDNAPDKDKEKC